MVYVHGRKGTLGAKCGGYRHNACKDLRTAIENMGTTKKTVHLIGESVMTKTIPLLRDISITSNKKDKGMINGKSSSIYAFTIKKGGIKVEISNQFIQEEP